MDYKELIEWLRRTVERGDEEPREYCTNRCGGCEMCDQAADALETLLAERDAAVADMHRMGCKKCDVCKHVGSKGSDESPCRHCCHGGGFDDYFEWRGQQKEAKSHGH